ncbi:MAG: protein kinase [Gammaproteobacteria bacterium]|nr:protein kinase [Gammaproteobacteria bacterium]
MEAPDILANKYKIKHEIARGAFGVVYLAHHTALDRDTAIKALHAHYSEEPNFRKRFLREAKALAKLNHENIVSIYDIIEEENRHYIVMEFVDGESLYERLSSSDHLSLETAVDIALQTAKGLEYAHQFGIVHRDIKPQNIMLDKNGKVKLTDFGIVAAADEANLTMVGQVIGTPRYMSPEQAFGQEVDSRSDIYSLGIVFYQMISGKTPFDNMSSTQVLHELYSKDKALNIEFPTHTPQDIKDLISSMVEKDASRRIGSTELLVAALNQIKSGFDQDKTNILFHHSSAQTQPTQMEDAATIDDSSATVVNPIFQAGARVVEDHTVLAPQKPAAKTPSSVVNSVPTKKSGVPVAAIAASALAIAVIGGGVLLFQDQNGKDSSPKPVAEIIRTEPAPVASNTQQNEARSLANESSRLQTELERRLAETDKYKEKNWDIAELSVAKKEHEQANGLREAADASIKSGDFAVAADNFRKAIAQQKIVVEALNVVTNKTAQLYETEFSREVAAFDKLRKTAEKSRDSAGKLNAKTLASNHWNAAETAMDNAEQTARAAERSFGARRYADAMGYLTDAKSEMDEAKKLFRKAQSASAVALANQKKLEQEQSQETQRQTSRPAKPTERDYNTISARLQQFEKAYEHRDLDELKQLIDLTPRQEAFLKSLFSKFNTVEISISSLELTSDTAMVRVTIDHLINDQNETTIPGKDWKTSQFVIKKKNQDWGKFGWM